MGRDPRDPRLLLRVLRDPEHQRRRPHGRRTRSITPRQIISLEHHLGIFHEETIQHWALHFRPLIIVANYFYGSLHFIVTIFAGIFLFRHYSDDYPRFRNTLAITTALALIGFTLFPLTPPRMFPRLRRHAAEGPAFWSFDSGGMQKVSNQFAAMPSVHIAWSTWCALALVPRLKNRTACVLAWCYPVLTLAVIIVTANHYFLDAVGGLVILAVGWFVANLVTRARASRRPELRAGMPAADAVA